MKATRCAVIGVGHIGALHARKYAQAPDAELVGVVDIDSSTAARIAGEVGCAAVTDYRQLLGQVEAASVAVPTKDHFEVARAFLESGTNVLLEKPMAATIEEAARLNRIARENDVLLQIGHIERFNPALQDLLQHGHRPLFIETHRLAPFKPRSNDIDVVLDLMIHDIDIILGLVDAPIRTLAASGARVLSDGIDIANARIEFENGCIANVTASRVSRKTERRMRVFLEDAYVAVDFHARRQSVYRLGSDEQYPGVPEIVAEEHSYSGNDALKAEIASFLAAVRGGSPVTVTGEDGQQALETAIRITDLVRASAPRLGANPAASRLPDVSPTHERHG